MTDRGTITLPKSVRPKVSLFEVRRREDGTLELIPQHAVAASQAWFWSERWQKMEREADADIAAGRTRSYESVDSFLRALDESTEDAV